MTRKLATIKTITNLSAIKNADAIELAEINSGWKVVVKKEEFRQGDKVLYIEVDAWVPLDLAPFLQKGDKKKKFNNVEGNRLRTIRLRGVLSQGLVLPLKQEYLDNEENLDEFLNINKFEKNIILSNGDAAGNFPGFIPKTDQERCQNMAEEIFNSENSEHSLFAGTLKMDGTSCTIYYYEGKIGVCSRNMEIKEGDNTYWNAEGVKEVVEFLIDEKKNLAFQGEIVGPGIQKNPHNLNKPTLFVFDTFDIDQQKYISPLVSLAHGANIVPFKVFFWPKGHNVNNIDDLLEISKKYAVDSEGNPLEGIVFSCLNGDRFTFKVINNNYLLNEK